MREGVGAAPRVELQGSARHEETVRSRLVARAPDPDGRIKDERESLKAAASTHATRGPEKESRTWLCRVVENEHWPPFPLPCFSNRTAQVSGVLLAEREGYVSHPPLQVSTCDLESEEAGVPVCSCP